MDKETLEKRLKRAEDKNKVLEKFIEEKSAELYRAQVDLKEKVDQQQEIFSELKNILGSFKPEDNGSEMIGNMQLIGRINQLVSDLKVQKIKAEVAAKVKSRFLAGMSHEIRTPMNGIQGLTNLLLNTPLNEKQRDYLEAIIHSSDTLLVLINDILDISKIEEGKLTLRNVPTNLKSSIQSIMSVMEVKALEKKLDFTLDYDEKLPVAVSCDGVRLNQILFNIIGNAIKFTDTGSVNVQVALKEQTNEHSTVLFKVTDTGIGIKSEFLPMIFKAFESRSNYATEKLYGGTGLGLAIVKKLIEMFHGEIHVESIENEGSTFTFWLQLQHEASMVEQRASDTQKMGETCSPMKVLLVEDNPINQLVAKDLLEEKHHSVVIANHGQEALEFLEKEQFNIILMDMQMPIMDGYETMRRIRKNETANYKQIPILALTAHAVEGEIDKCLSAGADDYLSKPYAPQDLFDKICELATDEDLLQTNPIETTPTEKETEVATVEGKLFCTETLSAYCNGNVDLMRKIVSMLIDSFPRDSKILAESAQLQNWEVVGAKAHQMKPNIKISGNDELIAAIIKIEKDSKQEVNVNEIPQLIDSFNAKLKEVAKELEELSI